MKIKRQNSINLNKRPPSWKSVNERIENSGACRRTFQKERGSLENKKKKKGSRYFWEFSRNFAKRPHVPMTFSATKRRDEKSSGGGIEQPIKTHRSLATKNEVQTKIRYIEFDFAHLRHSQNFADANTSNFLKLLSISSNYLIVFNELVSNIYLFS